MSPVEEKAWKYIALFLSSGLLLFGILCIGVAIPANMPDGTDKLKGIARPEDMPFLIETWSWTGLDRFSSSRPGGTLSWTIVERVDYTPIGACTDVGDVDAYTVVTKRVGLFGITLKEMVRYPPLRCVNSRS